MKSQAAFSIHEAGPMRRRAARSRRATGFACLLLALVAHADAAWCQGAETGELDRWVPSFGFSVGIIRQSGSGTQQNNLRPPDDLIDPPGPFPGTPSFGHDSLIDPFVVFSAELMSPGIGSVPGHPRLFAHGDVGGAFGSSVAFALEGDPGEFKVPPLADVSDVPGIAIGGQGTSTEVRITTLTVFAGAGIAFTADLFDRRLRLKPSLEYLQHGLEVTGAVRHVTGETQVESFITLHREKERTLHSIGGGLELEMDTMRMGPFLLALYANGQAYELLGDRKIHLSATDGINTATWDVTMDREIYRGSVGLRFRYLPEE